MRGTQKRQIEGRVAKSQLQRAARPKDIGRHRTMLLNRQQQNQSLINQFVLHEFGHGFQ